jgi:hypothetical protein
MANNVYIERTGQTAKIRNPWLVLLFTFISFGIYGIFWWYFTNRELRDLGRSRGEPKLGESPGLSVLAYTLGGIIYIPWIWTIVATNQRVQRAQRLTVGQSLNGWLAVAIWFFTFTVGGIVYMQYELNKVWRAPGMRPAEDPPDTLGSGDAERSEKLEQLQAAGVLSDDELARERERLGLT